MNWRLAIIIFLFFSATHVLAQVSNDPVASLIKELKIEGYNEADKAEAIFTWIALHITYDSNAANTLEIPSQKSVDVLASRKAVCEGYSRLFDTMCRYSGIESHIITGYVRNSENAEISYRYPNHAWNAFKIDGEWQLADISWASQAYEQAPEAEKLQAMKSFFKMQPVQSIFTHFPEDPIWQLLSTPLKFDTFKSGKEEIALGMLANHTKSQATIAESILCDKVDSLDHTIARYERIAASGAKKEISYSLGIAYYYKAVEISTDKKLAENISRYAIKRKILYYYDKAQHELSKLDAKDIGFDVANSILHTIALQRGMFSTGI